MEKTGGFDFALRSIFVPNIIFVLIPVSEHSTVCILPFSVVRSIQHPSLLVAAAADSGGLLQRLWRLMLYAAVGGISSSIPGGDDNRCFTPSFAR